MSRMLHCLHSFCEECLDKKMVGEGGDAGSSDTTINCPTCGHKTKVKIVHCSNFLTKLLEPLKVSKKQLLTLFI